MRLNSCRTLTGVTGRVSIFFILMPIGLLIWVLFGAGGDVICWGFRSGTFFLRVLSVSVGFVFLGVRRFRDGTA